MLGTRIVTFKGRMDESKGRIFKNFNLFSEEALDVMIAL